MPDKKIARRRMLVLILFSVLIAGLYTLRMIFLQLIHQEDFLAQATNTVEYRFTVTAARGDIVDSKGRWIVTNTTCHNIVLSRLLMGGGDLNETLRTVVEILRESGETWNDSLLISQPDAEGHYAFSDDPERESDQRALDSLKKTLGLQQYATADEVMAQLIRRSGLEDYSPEWQRVLGGIRWQMQSEAFSNVNNFTLAENVCDRTVATIKEHSLSLPGVIIEETSVRSYLQGSVLPHVIGRVGKITAERWRVADAQGNVTYPLRERGYSMNDIIGISGLESAMEDTMRGSNGVETITRDAAGRVIDTTMTTLPQPGRTVMLTVDMDFQKAVDEALEENIRQIAQRYGSNSNGVTANAGAVVVLDVKTGGVLASSNYPSFDQNLYSTQYGEYVADPGVPLYNRALQGRYTPGSTFKPAVALAALLSGTVNKNEIVNCTGVYNYFPDYHPKCTMHNHRGRVDLYTSIKWSCNIFYYDVGRRTTSEVYDDYASKLGMGVRTGVEVGESVGHLTTRLDSNYTASLEIQAAIGQGNTVVTPVQLATYAGTIANKGVRYRTHFVKALVDTNTGEIVEEIEPEIMEVIEDNIGAFDEVEKGMIGVSETISVLAKYPVTIACKTGTPQRSETYTVGGVTKHYDNTMMIAYGPVEDPQIAIGIAIEYGGGGSRAGNLVADIFDAYFACQSGELEQIIREKEERAREEAEKAAAEALAAELAAEQTAGEESPAA